MRQYQYWRGQQVARSTSGEVNKLKESEQQKQLQKPIETIKTDN